jgi:hypothetical protein
LKTTRTTVLSRIAGFTLAGLVMGGASPLTAQDDCKLLQKVVADAFSKIHSTPTHVATTTTINGKAFTSEMIYAAGNMYMKMNGKWSLAGSIKDMEQTEQDARRKANSNDTCRHLNDEAVNGEMAAVYSSHSVTSNGSIDLQFWISKASGQMLREDTRSSGALMSARYEYGNVKPPL